MTLTLPQAPNLLNPTGYSTPCAVPCWIQQVRYSCNLLDSVLTHLHPARLVFLQSSEWRKSEIGNLGVFGRPEHRRPAEKKIRDPIFRGAQKTGWLELCTKIQWTKILIPIFRGLRKTGTLETSWERIPETFFWYSSEDRRNTEHQNTNRVGCTYQKW